MRLKRALDYFERPDHQEEESYWLAEAGKEEKGSTEGRCSSS
jgi:hypothetical protein